MDLTSGSGGGSRGGDHKFRLEASQGIDEGARAPAPPGLDFSHPVDTLLIEIVEIKAQTKLFGFGEG